MKSILLLTTVLFYGCEIQPKKEIAIEVNNGRTVYDFGWHQHIRVYEIDSCEYIGFSGTSDGGASIIHKHNCKFCTERSKK